MRLLNLRLKGYLGIANGLLRDEVQFDFSKCKHRICLIKGATGSGKTTILDAISPLPDDNSILVPGMPAEKELIYDNGLRILIQHPIGNSGDRATNKAFIWDGDVNLNPNGNITSFKEIIYDRLGIDNNFNALSKLSTRDRGLADKPPAVRKKYVASIVEGVEVYNNMYKTLSKNSNVLKSMIKTMTAKIDSIGDERGIDMNISALTSLIAEYKEKQEKLLFDQASATTILNTVDPDGAIANESRANTERASMAENSIKICDAKIKLGSDKLSIEFPNKESVINFLEREKKLLTEEEKRSDMAKSEISNLLSRSEAEHDELQAKLNKLNMLVSTSDYDTLVKSINKISQEIKEIEDFFAANNITDTSCTTAEYNAALSILDRIENDISDIYDTGRDSFLDIHLENGIEANITSDSELAKMANEIDSLKKDINELERQIARSEGEIETYAILKNRPSNCTIDDCPFIKKAIDIGEDPSIKITRMREDLNRLNSNLQEVENIYIECSSRNVVVSKLMQVWEFIDENKNILKCLPMHNDLIMGPPEKLIYEIISRSSAMAVAIVNREALVKLGRKTYMFDSYRELKVERDKLIMQKSVFDSKAEVIDEINSDIEKIRNRISNIEQKIDSNNAIMQEAQNKIDNLNSIISIASDIEKAFIEREAALSIYETCSENNAKIAIDLEKIVKANEVLKTVSTELTNVKSALEPAEEELSKLKFSKQKLAEYKDEMAFYKANYDKTETVKSYTSPTDKGIQLIFMDMYMHNILAMANDLLSKLFGGQFMLQPFVITGDEFRIPCIGNRMMNDDISSMSTGQICMISMILSFSILFNSASNYNILRLDEIDGGLDAENRAQFIQTLNEVMDILGCEQCFLISHNEEIQYASTDMILLKTNSEIRNYGGANVIFDINRGY